MHSFSGVYPKIVFLNVSDAHLEHPIANSLTLRIPGSGATAFRYPLWNAMSGLLCRGEPALDMGLYDAEVPFTPPEARLFYPKLEACFKEHFGDEILAEMAFTFLREDSEFYDTVIFADCANRSEEIRFIANRVGRDRCTILNIGAPNLESRAYLGAGGMTTIAFDLRISTFSHADFESEMDRLASVLAPNEAAS